MKLPIKVANIGPNKKSRVMDKIIKTPTSKTPMPETNTITIPSRGKAMSIKVQTARPAKSPENLAALVILLLFMTKWSMG